jgi:arylsulfatase A-like enzyme
MKPSFACLFSTFAALAWLASQSMAADKPSPPSKPNIILFLVDDMGWMDCGAYGSKYYETPNMDRFAAQAMRFTDAYAQPLCSPTRASILTGQYSSRHGVTSASGHQPPQPDGHAFLPERAAPGQPLLMPESKNYLEPAQYTLAEALRDAGYRTGHFGKWHLGLTPPHWPETQGFDVAFHAQPSPGPPGEYFSPYGVVPPGEQPDRRSGKTHVGTITDGPPGEYITDRLTDEALKFIESAVKVHPRTAGSSARPFFLNFWHYAVHGPWGHKAAYTAEFAKQEDPRGVQGNPIMTSMLKSVDESLGRVLDKLDELDIAGDTIVIFYSDNGGNVHSMTPEDARAIKRKPDDPRLLDWRRWAGDRPPTNNAPLRNGKGRLYEGGVRVPLMVRWPGKIAAAATSDAVVGCIDLYPTILDLAGLPLPPAQTVDGLSFAPVLMQTGSFPRDTYFIWFPHLVPGVAVRRGDWKLIRRFQERPADYEGLHELFNLKDDLGETNNLAAQLPEKVKELDALIDAFVNDTQALHPRPNPAYQPRPAGSAKPGPKTPADPAQGLVPKFCRLTRVAEALRVEADGRTPFLGTAQVKHAGPLTLRLRARSAVGGAGRVQWKTAAQDEFPATGQTVEFTLPAGDQWQDVSVALPIQGQTAIIRLYLPARESPVEIQSLQFVAADADRLVRAWNFGPTE